jgi:hypothetical protein
MDEKFKFPYGRALLFYAGSAAILFGAGVVWAVTEHHHIVFCVAVFYYMAAGIYAMYGVFSQAAGRSQYLELTIEERRTSFWTQMFFLAIAALLVATAVGMQLLF